MYTFLFFFFAIFNYKAYTKKNHKQQNMHHAKN